MQEGSCSELLLRRSVSPGDRSSELPNESAHVERFRLVTFLPQVAVIASSTARFVQRLLVFLVGLRCQLG